MSRRNDLFLHVNPKNNGVAFDSYNTGYLTEEGSDILGFSSLDYLGVDDVDSKYDPTSHKMTLNVYFYGDKDNDFNEIIKESMLTFF